MQEWNGTCPHISSDWKWLSHFYLIILEERFQTILFLLVWLRSYKNIFWFSLFLLEYFCNWLLNISTPILGIILERFFISTWMTSCPQIQAFKFLLLLSVWPLSLCHISLLTSLLHAGFCYNSKLLPKHWIQLFYSVMSKFILPIFPLNFSHHIVSEHF